MGPTPFDDTSQIGTTGLYGSGPDLSLPAPQTDQGFSLAPPTPASLYPQTPASTPPFVSPQQTPQQQQPKTRLQLALAAMIPVALAKGGPGAAAALIQGVQQAQARSQQLAQQQTLQQQQQRRLDLEQQRILNNEQQGRDLEMARQRQSFMRDFNTRLQSVTTPEDVNALLDEYGPMAQPLGLSKTIRSAVNGYAQPDKLRQKRAKAMLDNIRKSWPQAANLYGVDANGNPNASVTFEGQSMTIPDLARLAGVGVDYVAGQQPRPAHSPYRSDFDQYFAEEYVPKVNAQREAQGLPDLTPAEQGDARLQARTAWAQAGAHTRQPAKAPATGTRGFRDNPALPVGVQNYLASLRSQGLTRDDVASQVFDESTWNSLIAAHPHLSANSVSAAINRMFTVQGSQPSPSARRAAGAASAPTGGPAAPPTSVGQPATVIRPGGSYRIDPATGELVEQ